MSNGNSPHDLTCVPVFFRLLFVTNTLYSEITPMLVCLSVCLSSFRLYLLTGRGRTGQGGVVVVGGGGGGGGGLTW